MLAVYLIQFTYLLNATWRMNTVSYCTRLLLAIDRLRWDKLLGNRNPGLGSPWSVQAET